MIETTSPSLVAQNINLGGYTLESRGTPQPAALGSLRVQARTIRGDTNNHDVSLLTEHGDSALTTLQDMGDVAPLDRGHDAEYFVFLTAQCLRNLSSCTRDIMPSRDKIRTPPSSVWSSLRKFVHVERHSPHTLLNMAPRPLSVRTHDLT